VLKALQTGRGRGTDVAKRSKIDLRVVWHSLKRLTDKGLVAKDEFGIYSLTSGGLAKLNDLEKDRAARWDMNVAMLSRHSESASEKELDELQRLVEKMRGGDNKGESGRAQRA